MDEITPEEKEMLEYMEQCTKLDPPDVAPVSTSPGDGCNVEGDSDGDGE